jgi:hypothetical protein
MIACLPADDQVFDHTTRGPAAAAAYMLIVATLTPST